MRQSDDAGPTGEPPRNKRSSYTEQTNEPPKLLEDEPAEVERELPAGDNSSVERTEPRDRPASPLFED